MLGRPRRLALLAEGAFTPTEAKSAVGVLRYRASEVAAVIDSTRAGVTAHAACGVGGDVPVVRDVAEAAAAGADSLLIGIAPQGGGLPPAARAAVEQALERGWDVLSGLHVFLADDPALAALAAGSGARILDARRPPAGRPIAAARAAGVGASVVLTVGSDCNVGKMTAALELVAELRRRGTRAAFVATGQTGIFVADRGVAVDAVVSDFAAGAIEAQVLAAARDADVVVVEGQGALHHPAYSGVTLSLLHGAAPESLVLCHATGRAELRVGDERDPGRPVAALTDLVAAYETAAAWVRPAAVAAVALNTLGLGDEPARRAIREAAAATGLPATDPVRFGAGPIADAVLERRGRRRASHA